MTLTVVITTGIVVDVVATVDEVVVGGSVTFGVVVVLFVVVVVGTLVVDFVVVFVVLVVVVVVVVDVVVVVGAGCKFKTISSFWILFLENFHFYNMVNRCSNSGRESENNFFKKHFLQIFVSKLIRESFDIFIPNSV